MNTWLIETCCILSSYIVLHFFLDFKSKIQTYQNMTLRKLINDPPYVSYLTLHNDLHVKSIEEESVLSYKRFFSRLGNHNNPIISNLNNFTLPDNPRRRLKRRWCRDLLQVVLPYLLQLLLKQKVTSG
jgi:hypothetical protein